MGFYDNNKNKEQCRHYLLNLVITHSNGFISLSEFLTMLVFVCSLHLLESRCRRSYSNLETQHLDTLKNICQTHRRSVCIYVFLSLYFLQVYHLFYRV